jgi:hypothetical protein
MAALCIMFALGLAGCIPLFLWRFRHDGKGRVLFRAAFWGSLCSVLIFFLLWLGITCLLENRSFAEWFYGLVAGH